LDKDKTPRLKRGICIIAKTLRPSTLLQRIELSEPSIIQVINDAFYDAFALPLTTALGAIRI
jgi:hypothetical protein